MASQLNTLCRAKKKLNEKIKLENTNSTVGLKMMHLENVHDQTVENEAPHHTSMPPNVTLTS